MTTDIPIQSAAMLYVVHVRCSGLVGARSSLYRLEAMAPALIRSNSAWLFTARSLNSSIYSSLRSLRFQVVVFLTADACSLMPILSPTPWSLARAGGAPGRRARGLLVACPHLWCG